MNDTAQNARSTLRALNGSQRIDIDRELVVGRDSACEVVLQEGQASRRHARLSPRPAGIWVEDLQSTNGTFINDQRIEGGAIATHGDVVRFDTTAFELQVEGEEESGSMTIMRPVFAPQGDTPREQVVAAKAGAKPPPAWALDGQQNVDGTQLFAGTPLAMPVSDAGVAPAADAVTVPTLLGLGAPVRDVRFQMIASGAVSQWEIGRAEGADIRIDDTSVSKNHAQIINEGARWKLVDLMSANGTYVNGEKGLTSYLKNGDRLRFGQVECQFLLAGQDQAQAATAQSTAADRPARGKLALLSFAVTAVVIAVVAWLVAGRS